VIDEFLKRMGEDGFRTYSRILLGHALSCTLTVSGRNN